MAVSHPTNGHEEDEEYIEMEVSSFSNLFCNSITSPPKYPNEFEFQMSSASMEREPTTSPADELFYKGKLLPLHLPPRLQMVEKLLQKSSSVYEDLRDHNFEEFYGTPLTTPTATSTPFESCNISPSESCRISRELNPEEYLFEFSSTDASSGFNGGNPKKSWTKKLKLIKQSSSSSLSSLSITSKLKASRAYLKSLFGKSGCSNESCSAAKVADEGSVSVSKAKERLDRYMKSSSRKIPSNAVMGSFDKEKITTDDNGSRHRRSFSFAIKRHSTNKSSFSSSSRYSPSPSSNASNNGFQYLQFLRRSSSVNVEIENPIQGAIAHCKQSHQQLIRSRKRAGEVGLNSFSASSIAICEDQDRPDLCRG